MAYVKAEIRTPDGRPSGTTSVNPNTVSTMGRKVDRETGRTFEYRNEHGKIVTKWVSE